MTLDLSLFLNLTISAVVKEVFNHTNIQFLSNFIILYYRLMDYACLILQKLTEARIELVKNVKAMFSML